MKSKITAKLITINWFVLDMIYTFVFRIIVFGIFF